MATAEAQIVKGRIVCSRCGNMMQPEVFWHIDHGEIPVLLWRCEIGHITQAVPVPGFPRTRMITPSVVLE